ncbi:MAG: inositol monophosphatase [Lachnospiraceae bacterium]|nr:inositol monophosphatase [Lachnospiraceae bacterium]
MSELLEKICDTAKDAGKIILEGSEKIRTLKIENKAGHGNYVTEYDSKVQKFLVSRLSEILPEANFVGEENGQEIFKDEYAKGFTFVIDPIDGTTNFIKGWNESVTSIGLLKDGAPYIGVIYNPYSDLLYYAEIGEGAYLNGERIHTSEDPLEETIIIMGTSPYYPDLSDKCFVLGREAVKHGIDIRRGGSAATDLCRLSSGQAGMFFELTLGLWDYAAGAAILLEAGGEIMDIKGNPLNFRTASSVVALSKGVSRTQAAWVFDT